MMAALETLQTVKVKVLTNIELGLIPCKMRQVLTCELPLLFLVSYTLCSGE